MRVTVGDRPAPAPGQACKAKGRGVTKDDLACRALIFVCDETADGGAGEHQEIEFLEQRCHAGTEVCEALMEWSKVGGGERGSPVEALRD
jgi:hypothetical protein